MIISTHSEIAWLVGWASLTGSLGYPRGFMVGCLAQDPPVLLLENVLSADECKAFVESMRTEDGSFPERLGQANLDVPLGMVRL